MVIINNHSDPGKLFSGPTFFKELPKGLLVVQNLGLSPKYPSQEKNPRRADSLQEKPQSMIHVDNNGKMYISRTITLISKR